MIIRRLQPTYIYIIKVLNANENWWQIWLNKMEIPSSRKQKYEIIIIIIIVTWIRWMLTIDQPI